MTLVPSPTKVIVWFDLSGAGNAQGPFAIILEADGTILAEDGDVFAQEYDQAQGFFTLNDPIKGQLGSLDYVLAGDIAQDITTYVQGVAINRGRPSLVFSDVLAGRWTLTLNNFDRTFDPFFDSSPFLDNIVPGKRIQIRTYNNVIADGFIEDWNLFYAPNGRSTAQIVATDGLAALAAIELAGHTATSQGSGARVNAILDRTEVGWGLNRSIATGSATLQADTVDAGTNVLAYLQAVNRTELGKLFMSRNGVLTFRGRDQTLDVLSGVKFSDTGADIPYQGISVQYGSDLLYNRIRLQRVGGTEQTVDDAASIEKYRPRTFSATELLHNSDAQVLELAQYLLGIYKEPAVRIAGLDIDLSRLTETQRQSVIVLDIGDVIEVQFTPNNIGDPIAQWAAIEGIEHRITPSTHEIRLSLGSTVEVGTFLTLNDPVLGRLNLNVLGF